MEFYEGLIKNTEFFTTAELAEKLKMNVQVITRKVQAGEIEAFKIGKDWRIPEQSVYMWLQKHSNKTLLTANPKKDKKTIKQTDSKQITPEFTDRKYLLEYILAQFKPHKDYSEKEVNMIISRYNKDTDSIRHQFLTERMMDNINGKYRRSATYCLSD
ncbi:MAG: DUF2087 domain-containing protein [FCB group bacterium]|nr:DUF2087 domain-containing protein [FCB group bacterium]